MNCFHRFVLRSFNLLYPYKIYGKENVPDGGAVLICNHLSGVDGGFIADVYNKDIFFLAKKELFKNKLVAKVITSFGVVPIDRENTDIKSMLTAIKILKEGHKLAIFPEGTRNKADDSDDLQEVKGGAALFAVKSKTPIVPIIIYKKPKMFRKTRLIVGPAFELSDFYGKKITAEEINQMGQILKNKMLEQQEILHEKVKNKAKC